MSQIGEKTGTSSDSVSLPPSKPPHLERKETDNKKDRPSTLHDFACTENLVEVFRGGSSPVYVTMDVYNETIKSMQTLSKGPQIDFDSTFSRDMDS